MGEGCRGGGAMLGGAGRRYVRTACRACRRCSMCVCVCVCICCCGYWRQCSHYWWHHTTTDDPRQRSRTSPCWLLLLLLLDGFIAATARRHDSMALCGAHHESSGVCVNATHQGDGARHNGADHHGVAVHLGCGPVGFIFVSFFMKDRILRQKRGSMALGGYDVGCTANQVSTSNTHWLKVHCSTFRTRFKSWSLVSAYASQPRVYPPPSSMHCLRWIEQLVLALVRHRLFDAWNPIWMGHSGDKGCRKLPSPV